MPGAHRYKYDRGPYVAEERMAKALSRGFNGDAGAVMPRDFRRDHGPCQSGDTPKAAAPARARRTGRGAEAGGAARAGRRRGLPLRRPHPLLADDARAREATWFLKHCPGVKMDGNNDGVPCERQWCRP